MKHRFIRMPRWILAGMPAVWAALCLGHTAGSAALFMWLLSLFLQKQPQYPYPRKSRRSIVRLFFAFSGGAFLMLALAENTSFIAYPGIACFSVVTAGLMWQWQLPKKWQAALSILLLIIACM